MSGNTEYIYYTEDFGRTWTQIDKSHLIGNIRLVSAATSPNGDVQLFGASWGEFYITKDNCTTLTPVPTPHSQGKYKFTYSYKRDPNKRPAISKIRVYGERCLVTQDGRVFITQSDSIDWQPLKDAYDYEVTKGGNLYVIHKDGSVRLYDNGFAPLWSSGKNMSRLPQSVTCRNESLFAICGDEVYKINTGEFIVSGLFTDDFPLGSGYDEYVYDSNKLIYNNVTYTYDNKDLLCKEADGSRWYRLMSVDFHIGNAVVYDGKFLISDASLDRYYKVDLDKKTVKEYLLPDNFIRTSDNPVFSFTMETGSRGCFHNNVQYASYNRKDDAFVTDRPGGGPRKIDAGAIDRLVEAIVGSRNNTLSASDLELTASDIDSFKKLIEREAKQSLKELPLWKVSQNPYRFPDFDTDFEFYKNMADSLYAGAIADSFIDAALRSEYGNWSSTTDWKSVTIGFRNGYQLKLRNSDDQPNYMLTPWLVDYKGIKFKGNSISIGRILTELSSDNFIASPFKDKDYLIFKIVDYLYRQDKIGG